MTDKFYDIYFDRLELTVSCEGELMNPEALHIIELEYDEAEDKVVSIRRVDRDGKVIETAPDIEYLNHAGYGDDPTIRKALDRFDKWLEEHLVWDEIHATRYQPAEYICIGIEGCVEERPYRPHHWRWF